MHSLRSFSLLAVIAATSLTVHADVVPDPEIVIDDTGDSSPFTQGTTFSPDCTGEPDGSCGGINPYFNATGGTITFLEFQVALTHSVPSGGGEGSFDGFNCAAPGIFSICTITIPQPTPNDQLIVEFIATGSDPGLPPGQNFIVNLNDNNALTGNLGGWSSGESFTAAVVDTPTPEPSMNVLLGMGCALIFLLARRRLQSRHQ
ncbi:MAG: hypothetical protein JOZ22_07610 [Acidobacteriia bacterium]|nr:hypothetical protein [Terriglobia bacterium]